MNVPSVPRESVPRESPESNVPSVPREPSPESQNPEAAKYLGTHSIGDDEKIFTLQAADAAIEARGCDYGWLVQERREGFLTARTPFGMTEVMQWAG